MNGNLANIKNKDGKDFKGDRRKGQTVEGRYLEEARGKKQHSLRRGRLSCQLSVSGRLSERKSALRHCLEGLPV